MLFIVADEGDLDERIDAPVLTFQDILRHPGSR